MSILNNYDGFILDLDGVIYLGNKLIPHSRKYVERITRLGIKYVFVIRMPGQGLTGIIVTV